MGNGFFCYTRGMETEKALEEMSPDELKQLRDSCKETLAGYRQVAGDLISIIRGCDTLLALSEVIG